MVHLPPDTRLLSNLLSAEYVYTKNLSSLLSPHSALALSALSAYASASPPGISNVLVEVVGLFGRADEALAAYVQAVERWVEHMKTVKEGEEDVRRVARDRDILVTRLIKASKSTKASKSSSSSHRDSLHLLNLHSHTNASCSSLSLSQDSEHFSSPANSIIFNAGASPSPHPVRSSKLGTAQAELQACEVQLQIKERELGAMRVRALKEGLNIRLRAMVECGWVWGECGKEALRALEKLHDNVNGFQPNENGHVIVEHSYPSTQTRFPHHSPPSENKPLPVPIVSQDHSSNAYQDIALSVTDAHPSYQELQMYIPPAHAISDSESHFPATTSQHDYRTSRRHVLERRITEEELSKFGPEEGASSSEGGDKQNGEEGPGSSAEEEEPADVEVVENPRFVVSAATPDNKGQQNGQHQSLTSFTGQAARPNISAPSTPSPKKGILAKRFSLRRSPTSASDGAAPSSPPEKRTRAASVSGGSITGGGLFGSIRGIFSHQHNRTSSSMSSPAFYGDDSPSRLGKGVLDGEELGSGGRPGKKKWKTRTDQNLRELRRGRRENNDDEGAKEMPMLKGSSSGRRGRVVSDSAPASPTSPRKVLKKPPLSSSVDKGKKRQQGISSSEVELPSTSMSDSKDQDNTVKRPKARRSASSPPISTSRPASVATVNDVREEGIREGFSVTVVGSSSGMPRRAQTPDPGSSSSTKKSPNPTPKPSPLPVPIAMKTTNMSVAARPFHHSGEGQLLMTMTPANTGSLSRNSSVKSSASAPVQGSTALRRPSGRAERGEVKGMPSLMTVIGADGGSRAIVATSSSSTTLTTSKPGRMAEVKPLGRVADPRGEQQTMKRGRSTERSALEVPRAPGSVFDTQSFSSSSTVRAGDVSTSMPKTPPKTERRPAKSPLRSALRNSSRTPSPMALVTIALDSEAPNGRTPSPARAVTVTNSVAASAGLAQAVTDSRRGESDSDDGDGASISSYETGHETFFEFVEPGDNPVAAPVEVGNGSALPVPSKESDISSTSTFPGHTEPGVGREVEEANRAPRRRKSVRVSLQPTFSTTPPAIYDDDEEDTRRGSFQILQHQSQPQEQKSHQRKTSSGSTGEAWWTSSNVGVSARLRGGALAGTGGKKNRNSTPDMWEDSSEEDVEYTQARKLLNRWSGLAKANA